jgi:hypothetical protein
MAIGIIRDDSIPSGSTHLTLEQIRDTITGLVKQGSSHLHEIGRLYNYVVDNKLAESGGYKNAREYFRQNIKVLSQTSLSNYGTVARHFSAELCMQYGMTNLRTLLTYAQSAGLVLGEGDPGSLLIDVPQEAGPSLRKPFSECSVEELERATRAQRTPVQSLLPAADEARLQVLKDTVGKHFENVAPVRLTTRVQGGKTLLSVQDVPMSEVTRLTEALVDCLEAAPKEASAG